MAPTTPRTWSTGEVETAAIFNTHIRDNTDAAMGVGKAAARAYNSANGAIANATFTVIALDSERVDRQTLHSTSVNNSRLTIPTGWGGLWAIGGHLEYAANATGERGIRILRSATQYIAAHHQPAVAGGVNTTSVSISTMYSLAAGDYVELVGYQTSGGALNVLASTGVGIEFWAVWLSM